MLTLYPNIRPYAKHKLDVGGGHTLYIEESGTSTGIPAIVLHGGPGAGSTPTHRCFFDPKKYRIIIYDQRGCGYSTPSCSLENNTTSDLLSDIDKVADFLKLDQFLLFGGSFGATLALLYAQKSPEKVLGIILRGVFLAREKDIKWLVDKDGAARIFPDYWQEFLSNSGLKDDDDIGEKFAKYLSLDDELSVLNYSRIWCAWESACSTLELRTITDKQFTQQPRVSKSLAIIGAHYLNNRYFIEENQILKNMNKIVNIPGFIIHGRFDMVCPIENAFALYQGWPKSELNIIRKAGHLSTEPAIQAALVHATNEFAICFG